MGLDGVELILAIEETFGISIPDGDAAALMTPALLIKHVQTAVASKPRGKPCLSQRAFHRVRSRLCEVTNAPRREVKLDTRINRIFPKETREEKWKDFRTASEMTRLPDLRFGRGTLFSPTRVRDVVSLQISLMSEELQNTGTWTDQEVRTVVRHVIAEQLGIKHFDDNDEFVQDLGVD